MQIFVRTLIGNTITLEIESSATVEHVRRLIQDEEDILIDLVFEGTILEEGKILSDYNICDNSTLHVTERQEVGYVPACADTVYHIPNWEPKLSLRSGTETVGYANTVYHIPNWEPELSRRSAEVTRTGPDRTLDDPRMGKRDPCSIL